MERFALPGGFSCAQERTSVARSGARTHMQMYVNDGAWLCAALLCQPPSQEELHSASGGALCNRLSRLAHAGQGNPGQGRWELLV